MPNKMERFTQRARRVLSLAQEEAERLQHNFIGTEHLLLGLMREEGGVAGRVLRDLGVQQDRIEELVNRLTRATTRQSGDQLDLSPGTKRVLELGVDEARRMGHHYIGTEHLLLGVVRQSEGTAIEVLKRLGVSPEAVRRQVRRVLQESPVQPIQSQRTGPPGGIASALNTIFGTVIVDSAFQCDVYMLMPYAAELQPVYNEVIKPVIEAQELQIKRADDFYSNHDMIREIWSCIARAKFIIADCTGKNPNVFYELGIAHTLGKPFILLTQNIEDLPFAVRGKRALVYENTPEGREALGQWLRTALENIANET